MSAVSENDVALRGADGISRTSANGGVDTKGCRQGDPVTFELPDGVLAGYLWRATSASSRMVFCHANGFCASVYRSMLRQLPHDVEILALDLRGHGRSTLPANPSGHRSWSVYARDISLVIDQATKRFGDLPIYYAGHSMGAVSALLCAADRGDAARVALIEPVLLPSLVGKLSGFLPMQFLLRRSRMVQGALARRSVFESRDEVLSRYRDKPIFSDWQTGVLEDYLDDGLTVDGDTVRLSCAPAWEAANFAAQANRPFSGLKDLTMRVPVSVVFAEHGSTVSPSARKRLKDAAVTLERADGAGHLFPMQYPDRAADFLIRSCLE
ncbi:MAG: alpha/beta fold hydrolase [Pseudomonadota bacterium]